MKLYKFLLVVAVITIIALFVYPRAAAHASPEHVSFPEAPQATVKQMVTQYASFYGVSGKLAKAIVECESKFQPNAKNPSSSARGLYQFLGSSWRKYALERWGYVPDVQDARYSAELGAWVLATYGTHDWLASIDCWGNSG